MPGVLQTANRKTEVCTRGAEEGRFDPTLIQLLLPLYSRLYLLMIMDGMPQLVVPNAGGKIELFGGFAH